MSFIRFGAAMVVVLASGAASAGPQDFKLTNRTGFTINEVYVEDSKLATWGDDVLGTDALISGASTPITFSGYSAKTCLFDIRIVDADGGTWDVEQINLCETNKVTFKVQGKKVIYTAE
jgi:hypothetical protein